MFMNLVSCQKDDTPFPDGLSPFALKSAMITSKGLINTCGSTIVLPLINKVTQIGTVEINNDEVNLNVTFTTTVGTFTTIKLFIGNNLITLPRSNGSGQPEWGRFPYKSGEEPYLPADGLTQYTFTFPLTSLNTDFVLNETTFHFVVQANVLNGDIEISANAGTKVDASNKKSFIYDTYIININDFTVPENGSISVPCGTVIEAPILPVVVNACGTVLIPTEPVITNNLVNGSGTVIYAYTYTDAAKHSHEWTYTYTVMICEQDAWAKGTHTLIEMGLSDEWGWAINQGSTVAPFVGPTTRFKMTVYISCGFRCGYSVQVGYTDMWYDEENFYAKMHLNSPYTYAQSWTGRFLMIQLNGVNGYFYPAQIQSLSYVDAGSPTTEYTATIPLSSIPNWAGLGNPIYIRNEVGTNSGPGVFINTIGSGLYTEQYINTIVPPEPIVNTVEYPLYIDAQNNVVENGTLVGKVLVSFNGERTAVKYVLNQGYEMTEANIYVNGNQPTYPIQWGSGSFTQDLSPVFSGVNFNTEDLNADGKVWIVCHAKVKTL